MHTELALTGVGMVGQTVKWHCTRPNMRSGKGCRKSRGMSMTIKEEIFDQIEELNCSLRELTDYELVDCRQALINRTNILMGLMEELCDS